MLAGTITHLLKDGRGFIETHDGVEFGFHRDDLDDVEFNQLDIGHAVQFAEDFGGNAGERRAVQIKTSLRRVV